MIISIKIECLLFRPVTTSMKQFFVEQKPNKTKTDKKVQIKATADGWKSACILLSFENSIKIFYAYLRLTQLLNRNSLMLMHWTLFSMWPAPTSNSRANDKKNGQFTSNIREWKRATEHGTTHTKSKSKPMPFAQKPLRNSVRPKFMHTFRAFVWSIFWKAI